MNLVIFFYYGVLASAGRPPLRWRRVTGIIATDANMIDVKPAQYIIEVRKNIRSLNSTNYDCI